jgi:hypothetical protein
MCEIVSGERSAVGAGTGVGSASACVSAAVASGSSAASVYAPITQSKLTYLQRPQAVAQVRGLLARFEPLRLQTLERLSQHLQAHRLPQELQVRGLLARLEPLRPQPLERSSIGAVCFFKLLDNLSLPRESRTWYAPIFQQLSQLRDCLFVVVGHCARFAQSPGEE